MGRAAQAIAKGVAHANERLTAHEAAGGVALAGGGDLQLIELYLDRATEAHHALSTLATTSPLRFALVPQIETGHGGLPRPLRSGYRGAGYDFITVGVQQRRGRGRDRIHARHAARSQRSARPGDAVEACGRIGPRRRGRQHRMRRSAGRCSSCWCPWSSSHSSRAHRRCFCSSDSRHGGIPWELLDTRRGESSRGRSRPWAVRTRVLRKLRTADFRRIPRSASDGGLLVIGEPECDPQKYSPLPGARKKRARLQRCWGWTRG